MVELYVTATVTEPIGWSDSNKRQLLLALQEVGDSDLNALLQKVPTKSCFDIKNMITYYKKKVEMKWLNDQDRPDELGKWIDLLERMRSKQKGAIQDIVPRALKYIALFEKTNENSDIDLSKAYTFLMAVSSGKPTEKLSERTSFFLYRCLVKLAEIIQKQHIDEPKKYLEELNSFKELLKNSTESPLNPFNIPDHLLTMSSTDMNEDVMQ